MSTVWLRVSRGDCLTPAPPGQQGPPKLLVRRLATRYSAQEAPAVSAHMIWAAAPGLPAESKVRGGGGVIMAERQSKSAGWRCCAASTGRSQPYQRPAVFKPS